MSKDYLDHVHICDSDRLPVGMGGTFDFDELGAALKEIGYEGYVSTEAFEKGDYNNNVKTSFSVMKKKLWKIGIIY